MTTRFPFSITARSITFYSPVAKRQFSLSADSPEFLPLRAALQAPGDHDHDLLVSLVDVRQSILLRSQGQIVLDEERDQIIWRGQPLANIWVDKILDYRAAGEDFTPIWNALQRLLTNPTPTAIERLPVFLERTGLGFLPDGRFLAFKGVDREFYSAHKATDGSKFRHLIGDICRMERSEVDADPNKTCSTGLHVGAPGYVKQHYSGASYQLVLVAVAPEDVVAVPTDYNGEKMRTCGYEVFDHLAQDYNDELLGRLKTTQSHGYGAQTSPEPEERDAADIEPTPYTSAKVGDIISWKSEYDSVVADTYSRVTEIDDNDPSCRIQVINLQGETEWVTDSKLDGLVVFGDVLGSMVAFEGCQVLVAGHPMIRDGEYVISGLVEDGRDYQDDADGETFVVGDRETAITNGCIQRVVYQDEVLFPRPAPSVEVSEARQPLRANVGDFVDIDSTGNGHPPAGRYPVAEVCPTGVILQTEYDGLVFVNDSRIAVIWRS